LLIGISKYDHSCFPNTVLVFNGYQAVLRPLVTGVDVNDPSKAFISYVDIARSKYQRQKELYEKWYFYCECSRCKGKEDDLLTSIKCPNTNCDQPIVITEESEPVKQDCSKCGAKISTEYILKAQVFMKALPKSFGFQNGSEEVKKAKIYLDNARKLLHPTNIYYCRLLTAYMQICPENEQCQVNVDSLKRVCDVYKRCLPAMDRHIGFQLLHIVRALIEKKQRSEAVQFAYEAMQIFEVCLGMDHPYYLQTLGLWTFLDNKAKKTDQELLNLMNFNYNRPVNLGEILEKVQSLGL
uniref:SET domain-containing protein n=1 Tax=Soboliphyme baturini TaxID=241478 RepID=A0A183J5D8_9BILA